MTVTIHPSQAQGKITAPPSKSMAHRLLLAAALSRELCAVENLSFSKDVCATLDCLKALGAGIRVEGSTVTVDGTGFLSGEAGVILPCGASGSTLRFLIPLLLTTGRPALFTGDASLFSRPLEPYREICAEQGCLFLLSEDRLAVQGRLNPGLFELPGNVSSQFVTGLLYALPLLNGPSEIRVLPPVESASYIKMSLLTLRDFGIRVVSVGDGKFHIPGNQKYRPHRTKVEGDWSNAAFLEALNLIGGKVEVKGLNRLSPQGDKVCMDHYKALLKGKPTINLSDCPDLAPILMAVAAACHGAIFTDAGRLRLKESDRGRAMAQELSKFGAEVVAEDERIWVGESKLHRPTEILDSHNDHRIAMALAVLCTLCSGTIRGAEAVSKSWPDFFRVLAKLGVEITEAEDQAVSDSQEETK